MKISVNLATMSSPRDRYALAWALPLTLAGAIGLVMLSYAAVRNYREYEKMRKQISALSLQKEHLFNKENVLKKELERPQEKTVYRKVQYVNGLIEKKRFSLTQVTESVNKLLPPTVRLSSMALTHAKEATESTQVRFIVVGKSEEALEAFLSNLEESPDFQEFTVSTQGFRHSDAPGAGVTISCMASYVGHRAE